MDRTVPKTGSEEIELYMRTYYSLLRSTRPVQLLTLVESHMNMESSLHTGARDPEPDVASLTYTSLRLPECILQVDLLLLGQASEVFTKTGYEGVESWERVSAPGRRRRMHFDGKNVLAVYIASRSDIDDLLPTLTAYQIEWNKIHHLLQSQIMKMFMAHHEAHSEPLDDSELLILADGLHLSLEEARRLQSAWGEHFIPTLRMMYHVPKQFNLQLLAGSLAHYRKATSWWWMHLSREAECCAIELATRPVYFVSSNTHSLANLITGFAPRYREALLGYLHETRQEKLLAEYRQLQTLPSASNNNNVLYYVLKQYLSEAHPEIREQLAADETASGIIRIPSKHGFDLEVQVIELRQLRPDWLDERVCESGALEVLATSDALILNIDYPLGVAAYDLLNEVAFQVGDLLGVYVMGKAASLNGRIGDVMIPNVVHDEHSQNTYMFNNCFMAADVAPFMIYGTVLDNQKAITARGTFLQNPRYMEVFYREGYTDIEMEAGPYLSAIYEAFRPKRHPYNEIVNLYGLPFDVGILHYASDTPMSKGRNLGMGSLGYAGLDPTYATAVAILRRILAQEIGKLRQFPALMTAQERIHLGERDKRVVFDDE